MDQVTGQGTDLDLDVECGVDLLVGVAMEMDLVVVAVMAVAMATEVVEDSPPVLTPAVVRRMVLAAVLVLAQIAATRHGW